EAVGVEPAVGRQARAALPVVLADHPRALGLVIEDVADEELAERALLLDDQELLEPAGELAHRAGLHREQHLDLHEPDAVLAERRIVQAELGEGLAQVVVRLARGRDAEPRVRRRQDDAVELGCRGDGLRRLKPSALCITPSAPRPNAARRIGFCVACHGRPSYRKLGSATTMRSGETSAVPISSATLVTILKPTQSPE